MYFWLGLGAVCFKFAMTVYLVCLFVHLVVCDCPVLFQARVVKFHEKSAFQISSD